MSIFWRTQRVVTKQGRVYYYRRLEKRWRENGVMRSKTIQTMSTRGGRGGSTPPDHVEMHEYVDQERERWALRIAIAKEEAQPRPGSFEARHAAYQHVDASTKAHAAYNELRNHVQADDAILDAQVKDAKKEE